MTGCGSYSDVSTRCAIVNARTVRRLTGKEIFILRAISESGDEDLDLRLSPEAKFSSNKLRSQLERLYLGVVSYFVIIVTIGPDRG